jgi:hypothetical protein
MASERRGKAWWSTDPKKTAKKETSFGAELIELKE